MAEPVGGPPEPPAQLLQMRRGPIGEGRIRLIPDMLSRVKLWGVGWEVVGMDPGMLLQIRRDLPPRVNGATIPQQHHRTPQMLQQGPEESPDSQAGESPVGGEAQGESQVLLARLLVRAWLEEHKTVDKQPDL